MGLQYEMPTLRVSDGLWKQQIGCMAQVQETANRVSWPTDALSINAVTQDEQGLHKPIQLVMTTRNLHTSLWHNYVNQRKRYLSGRLALADHVLCCVYPRRADVGHACNTSYLSIYHPTSVCVTLRHDCYTHDCCAVLGTNTHQRCRML